MALSTKDLTIDQQWHLETVALSYFISVTGSYCTIQLMEQWRLQRDVSQKRWLMLLSSISLGGFGIWSMHFTGMRALQMVRLDDGSFLEIDFEGGLTILSFIIPIVGVFVGLKCASTDPFFLEIEQAQRKEILAADLKNLPMHVLTKSKYEVVRKIKIIALFSRLWRIATGGFFAALGVLGMHYLGMLAQRTNADMHLNPGIVALSSLVAFLTANAAFWILFRALTFWPHSELLRIASALIMGVAVCGTHYIGMGAATYTYSLEDYSQQTTVRFRGSIAASVASYGAVFGCFWMSTFGVVRVLRNNAMQEAAIKTTNTNYTSAVPGASNKSRKVGCDEHSTVTMSPVSEQPKNPNYSAHQS